MPEEEKTIKDAELEGVKLVNEVKSVSPEEADSGFVQGDLNNIAFSPPVLSENQIIKGTGGKYLNQVEKTTTYGTAQATFQSVTDLAITKSISNRRVLLLFSGCISNDTINSFSWLTFDVDGTNQGGSNGLVAFRTPVASREYPVSMIYITSRLSGSHTFKVKLKNSGSTDTVTLGSANTNMVFLAIELSE